MPVSPERAALANRPAQAATALLVVDMISSWSFPDGDVLAARALRIAPAIGALRRRCRAAGVPTVFVNDNEGHWRSDFRRLLEKTLQDGGPGAAIAAELAPDDGDYAVLKPKHSAFFATPLDLLLRHLRVQRIVLAGVTADQCILWTAAEARVRDYGIVVASDGVAALTTQRQNAALRTMREAVGASVVVSRSVRWTKARPSAGGRG